MISMILLLLVQKDQQTHVHSYLVELPRPRNKFLLFLFSRQARYLVTADKGHCTIKQAENLPILQLCLGTLCRFEQSCRAIFKQLFHLNIGFEKI